MTTRKFTLSLEGMKELSKYLKAEKKALNRLPNEAVKSLVSETEGYMRQALMSVSDQTLEGAITGTVSSVMPKGKTGARGSVSYGGADAIFIEFGTGMVGKGSPHPLANKAGWRYYTDSPYKMELGGEKVWRHDGRIYRGIPAQRVAFDSFLKMRKNEKSIIKQSWVKVHD